MHITVIGRGNVGGGLARRWERAGHAVTELGHDGGDASDAEVVLVAGAVRQDRRRARQGVRLRWQDHHRRHQRLRRPQRGLRVAGARDQVDRGWPGRQGLQRQFRLCLRPDRPAALEDHAVGLIGAIAQGGLGMFFYCYTESGKL